MPKYIILSSEGFTHAPNDEGSENLQVLGDAFGDELVIALQNFAKENRFLIERGFDDVMAMEIKDNACHRFSL